MALIRIRKRVAAVLDGGPAAERSVTCSSGKKRRIGSDYEEESRLGEGSFGFVVRARHLVTGKIVAIKFLAKDSDVGEMLREACFHDACGGNLNVVGFEDLVRDPTTGDLCLAMAYVGPSLEDFLHHRPPLPEDTVRSFMFQLLTGAKEMQDRQNIHRDIKPANILIREDGKLVKICDFGLAMSMSEPAPYTQAGTMSYMAPEMLLEKPDYNALVDSWSLGCVMAELLTGNTLFQQPDQSNEIRQLRTIFRVLGVPSGRTWPGFLEACGGNLNVVGFEDPAADEVENGDLDRFLCTMDELLADCRGEEVDEAAIDQYVITLEDALCGAQEKEAEAEQHLPPPPPLLLFAVTLADALRRAQEEEAEAPAPPPSPVLTTDQFNEAQNIAIDLFAATLADALRRAQEEETEAEQQLPPAPPPSPVLTTDELNEAENVAIDLFVATLADALRRVQEEEAKAEQQLPPLLTTDELNENFFPLDGYDDFISCT